MERVDLIIVGAGPSGLSAAIAARKYGLRTVVFDENQKPGGQLFKQIHKFFGSKEHKAKIRGYKIGQELLKEAAELGVAVVLNSTVIGLYQDKEITVRISDEIRHYKGDAIIIATGASENMVMFDGWTLPGVIGAGAAQTMLNLHGVLPGNRILMLGSGNVGLVVSYQLKQCGCDVVAVIDAAPKIGGYGVHASKIARTGIPFYLPYTIIKAEGTDRVTGVTIGKVDSTWNIVPGSEKHLDVDTICLAVGLSPMSQLLKMAGCRMEDTPKKGGHVPVVNEYGETSVAGIFVCGDVSGIEEASSAMIEGKIAGIAAARSLGYLSADVQWEETAKLENALSSLRQGMFAPGKRGTAIELTEEGFPVSAHLLENGYLSEDEVLYYPGVTKADGVHPVIECTQNIRCNACQDACPHGCIKIGEKITSLPAVNGDRNCIGCGMCVAACPGQAIFLVNDGYEPGFASITMPYELLTLPQKGETGSGLGRHGEVLCQAEVIEVRAAKVFDRTNLVTIKVPVQMSMKVRFYQKKEA
jgi:thioredoxin reductase/Fe-S-cluster-containing hydrogenase component 2